MHLGVEHVYFGPQVAPGADSFVCLCFFTWLLCIKPCLQQVYKIMLFLCVYGCVCFYILVWGLGGMVWGIAFIHVKHIVLPFIRI